MQTICAIPQASIFGHRQTDTVIFISCLCTIHCTFHCVFSLCNIHVSFYQSHLKANGVKQSLTIHQFNVQTETAENKEQDT